MVSIRIYFTIFILMLMVFVMFMFVGVSSDILSNTADNSDAVDNIDISGTDTITPYSLNLDLQASGVTGTGRTVISREQKLHVAILGEQDTATKLLTEWCVYNKYLFRIFAALPDPAEISDYKLLLFGNYDLTAKDCERLYEYSALGKTMIFTRLPDYRQISASKDLADIFGISACISETVTSDGIKIFSDFMINKERIYRKGDYFGNEDDTNISIPYYSLTSGYEVYAVAIFDHQEELGIEDKDLPPLLWRTMTKESFVFVVNSDIFDGMSLLGVLTGFMSHESSCYLYPVVNAQTISLLNYPYFSNENLAAVQQLYSRTSEAVARDLLWPNIIQVLKNYGNSYSFFAASQLDYLDADNPTDHMTGFYLQEIDKLPGNMGLSLGQVSEASLKDIISQNESFFKDYLPNFNLNALYAADFNTDEIKSSLNHDFFKNIRLVMSDYEEGDQLISFLNDNVLSVKFNLNGYRHETLDDLQMCSIENALGMCNEKVDIGRVIYPKDSSDEWNYLSLIWSKGDTYFKDFKDFDMVSIDEMEKRIRRFLALDYTYECLNNDLKIHIDHFDEEAYFILRTYSRQINSVENGSASVISDSTSLIKATAADVTVHLTEKNVLAKPGNNKLISSHPE